MDVINFDEAEACAAAWLDDGRSEYGVEYARVFTIFRNLLRNSQDNNSTVEATATAIANVIRESAWKGWCSKGGDIYHAAPCWHNMMNMVEEIDPGRPPVARRLCSHRPHTPRASRRAGESLRYKDVGPA